jgi:hypothetical protein
MTIERAGDGGGRTIATYSNYRDAERAVDFLADKRFPVEHVKIVGQGLRLVEHVTGPMGWGRAALNGAVTGALVGGLVGWLFAIFDWFDPTVARGWLIIDGLWFGALIGAAMGLALYALTRGRRDFTSVGTMQASTYEVVVDEPYAAQAMQLIRQLDQAGAPTTSGTPAPGHT